MGRDKARDDLFFNCSQEHELAYVAGLYEKHSVVLAFLVKKCSDGTIRYMTHKEVYELIERELGLKIPASTQKEHYNDY